MLRSVLLPKGGLSACPGKEPWCLSVRLASKGVRETERGERERNRKSDKRKKKRKREIEENQDKRDINNIC